MKSQMWRRQRKRSRSNMEQRHDMTRDERLIMHWAPRVITCECAMRKIRACVRAVRCSLCTHQVATPTGQNCPTEKDFMIQRSSKSLKQTSARCKPRIVSHKHVHFKSNLHIAANAATNEPPCGQELTPDVTWVRVHNHVPEDLHNVSASSQKTRAAKSFVKHVRK